MAAILTATPTNGADPQTFVADARNVSEPDITFAARRPDNTFDVLTGVGERHLAVAPEQAETFAVPINQSQVVGIEVQHLSPEAFVPSGFGGLFVQSDFLVVFEQEIPEGWDVDIAINDRLTGNFIGPLPAIFAEHGEGVFRKPTGPSVLPREVLEFGDSDFRVTASPTGSADAGSEAVVRLKVFGTGFDQFILKDVAEFRFERPRTADLSAKLDSAGETFDGNNVFEVTPSLQVVRADDRIDESAARFVVAVENVTAEPQSFVLQAPALQAVGDGSSTGTARFLNPGSEDVTAQITSPQGFATPSLAPGESFSVFVEVQADTVGARLRQVVRAFEPGGTAVADSFALDVFGRSAGDLVGRIVVDGQPGPSVGDGVLEQFSQDFDQELIQVIPGAGEVVFELTVENDQLPSPNSYQLQKTRFDRDPSQVDVFTARVLGPDGNPVVDPFVTDDPIQTVVTGQIPPGGSETYTVVFELQDAELRPRDAVGEIPFASLGVVLVDVPPGGSVGTAPIIDTFVFTTSLEFPADLSVRPPSSRR